MTEPRSALQRVWAHPFVTATKGPIRNALWRARGLRLANPGFPGRVTSILFVCKGNICRSPFAARRAAQLLEEAGLASISVTSAGIVVNEGVRPPREGSDAAAAYGLSLGDHQPRQLTRELLMAHDMTVVMEAAQLRSLRETYPGTASRLFLLSLLDDRAVAGYERFNIRDPFGLPVEAFESCYRRIDHALGRLLRAVCGVGPAIREASSALRGERQ